MGKAATSDERAEDGHSDDGESKTLFRVLHRPARSLLLGRIRRPSPAAYLEGPLGWNRPQVGRSRLSMAIPSSAGAGATTTCAWRAGRRHRAAEAELGRLAHRLAWLTAGPRRQPISPNTPCRCTGSSASDDTTAPTQGRPPARRCEAARHVEIDIVGADGDAAGAPRARPAPCQPVVSQPTTACAWQRGRRDQRWISTSTAACPHAGEHAAPETRRAARREQRRGCDVAEARSDISNTPISSSGRSGS